MNVVIKIVVAIAFLTLLLGQGCKDPVEPIEENIAGVYRVYAKVTKRPKIFEPEYAPPWAYEMNGVWVDTTENVCCASETSKIEDCCPDEYVMEDFEIFLHDGVYYIRNKLVYDADSNRLTWDIPLTKDGINYNVDLSQIASKRLIRSSSENSHWTFHILEFSFKNIDLTGAISLINGSCTDFIYSCLNRSDNKTYRYGMGEFAELRFEKVK